MKPITLNVKLLLSITLKKSEYRNLPRKQKKQVKTLMIKDVNANKQEAIVIRKYTFIVLVRKYYHNGKYFWRPTYSYNSHTRIKDDMNSPNRLLIRKHSIKTWT
jgi:hypothetical protein